MKISKYPAATSITEADTFVMVQSGETKKVTVAVLKQLLDISGKVSGWTLVPAANYTTTPASTSTLTMAVDMTATIIIGTPLRYTIGGAEYFGICSAIAANLLTVNGAPLSGDVTALYVGTPDKVTQMVINVPSTYEDDSCTTLVATDLKMNIVWQKVKSYLVKYTAWSLVHDTGTDGQVSVRINGTEVNTTAGGLTIAADATLYSTVVDIATAAYDINNGETIEITYVKGGKGDATDLTMTLIFVTP